MKGSSLGVMFGFDLVLICITESPSNLEHLRAPTVCPVYLSLAAAGSRLSLYYSAAEGNLSANYVAFILLSQNPYTHLPFMHYAPHTNLHI